MGKRNKKRRLNIESVVIFLRKVLKNATSVLVSLAKFVYRQVNKWVLKTLIPKLHRLLVILRAKTTTELHVHFTGKYSWYAKWHEKPIHRRVHFSSAGIAVLLFIAMLVVQQNYLHALSDLLNTWSFSTPSDYSVTNGAEVANNKASLKEKEYDSDGDTVGLYHFNEVNGSTASDSSGNGNNATISDGSFVSGVLNNALSFDGDKTFGVVASSPSLKLTQSNTIEAWTKLNSPLSAGSDDRRQTVVDKGDYQLYFDNETGKAVYELANKNANTWKMEAGMGLNGSWDQSGRIAITSQVKIGGETYVGLGAGIGDAEVWKWNGSSWTMIGGGNPAINSSWPANTYENVHSLATDGTNLYAGLGDGVTEGEVWKWNGTTWSQIGGDSLNGSWAPNIGYTINSLEYFGGKLYAGVGYARAEVWSYDGSSWTRLGAQNFNGAWTVATQYVLSMTNDGTNLYVGLGSAASRGEVWRWNGTSWTQIGGGVGMNGSWGNTIESVRELKYMNGKLYAGTGDTAGDAHVWEFNGTSWTRIGGDGLNGSWPASTYEYVFSLATDGTNIYAGLGSGTGDAEVWTWNGSSWSKIGGDGLNGSWPTTQGYIVRTLMFDGGSLYAGVQNSAGDGMYYKWDGSAWTMLGGKLINGSWGYNGLASVDVMQVQGEYLYAGTGRAIDGNATVYRYDGNEWKLIGGQGVNNSWPENTYRQVMSMSSYKGKLIVGTGNLGSGSRMDGAVWQWDGTTWTQIGGNGVNSSWNVPPNTHYGEVDSLATLDNYLYAGLGGAANDGEVWRWDGTSWTKIGGDSLNGGWTNYVERVQTMSIYGGKLVAGLGSGAGDGEVWQWSGSSWSRIAGKGLNSSWDSAGPPYIVESVESLMSYNGKLYAGLGNSVGDGNLWEFDGTSWTQVGGNGINSSWTGGTYNRVKSLVSYNGDIYAGLGSGANMGEVWQLKNGSWTKVGGNSVNGSWSYAVEEVGAFSPYKGKLYAGTGYSNSADAFVYSWGDNLYLESTTALFDSNWHHVAGTYDGTEAKLYIDGIENSSATKPGFEITQSDLPLLIGASYGGRESGIPRGFINGQIDELRISKSPRTVFNSKPYSSSRQTVQLANAARKNGVWHWDEFLTTESGGGSITYRLSDDNGATWKYWDSGAWTASGDLGQSNPVGVINANITTFPVTFDGIIWQAVMQGNGHEKVTLSSVTLKSTSDATVPQMSGSSITGLKASGGSPLLSGAWTNGSSPEFSWTPGTDSESGVKGYCLYLGTDNSADPSTTKGLLGSSGLNDGSHCQFMINSNTVNLSTAGYIGTPMTSSNDKYYFKVKAIDNSGNVSNDESIFEFKFDNTPPNNPSSISAPSGYVNDKAVTLSWATTGGSAPNDTNSGIAGLQYRISNSGTWYGSDHTGLGDMDDLLSNGGSYTMQDPPDFGNLQDGVNTVYFRTFDNAGNVSPTYVTAAVKLNTSGAPSEPQNLTVSPSSNTVNQFSFTWNAPLTFVGAEGNITYCYTVNVAPDATNCVYTGGGITSLANGPFATKPGNNTLYVVAKDESGNINYGSYSSVVFQANTTAPGMPLNMDIVDVSIKSTSKWRLALTWDEPSPGGNVAKYEIFRSTDNNSFSLVGSSSSTTYIDAGLSQQRYYYKVKACDNTNNCGAFGTVVNALPTGKFTEPANLVSDPTVSNITTKKATISWSTDRTSDSKISIGTESGKYGSSEVSNSNQVSSHSLQLDNLAAGTTYYFVAKWTDEDGNTGSSQEVTFRTAPPPTLKEISATGIGLSSATIEFTSKNANKVDVMYGASEAFGGVITVNTSQAESKYSVNLNSLNDGSKYFYKLVSYDSEGTAYDGSVLSFTTPPRPRINNLRFQPVAGKPTSTQQVTWDTNVSSTTGLVYGKLGSNGSEVQQVGSTREHSLIISDLEDDSEYFLQAQSRDEAGNLAISDRQVFKTALDTRPPKISNVTIEPSIRGVGTSARGQVIVSWKTDELASSQVAYGEGSGVKVFNTKTAEDESLSFEHIVIVNDLPTSRVYSVQPVSYDKARNSGTGDPQSAIIGRASDDVLTLILTSLKGIFGL